MGFFSRLPTPNEPHRDKSKWGSKNEDYDDFACLLNGDAKRCCTCKTVVITKHQRQVDDKVFCPDCAPKT